MTVLRIGHPVADFARWKLAFDSDPAARRAAGVRRYQVLRAVDDPNYVLIDLEFATAPEAEAMLARLRTVWSNVEGDLIARPVTRLAEQVEVVAW
jgi:hypothetical protein